MKKQLTYATLIRCKQEELFDFHTDSANITKITPPNTKVVLLDEDTSTFEGKVVHLKTTRLGIPTYWDVRIEKLSRPSVLVDLALRSPLKYWRHQHIFTKKYGSCELRDVIEYELPFGIFNPLIEPLFERDITAMFAYRHAKTKEILES